MAGKLENKIDFIQVECQRKLWQVLSEFKTAVQQTCYTKDYTPSMSWWADEIGTASAISTSLSVPRLNNYINNLNIF